MQTVESPNCSSNYIFGSNFIYFRGITILVEYLIYKSIVLNYNLYMKNEIEMDGDEENGEYRIRIWRSDLGWRWSCRRFSIRWFWHLPVREVLHGRWREFSPWRLMNQLRKRNVREWRKKWLLFEILILLKFVFSRALWRIWTRSKYRRLVRSSFRWCLITHFVFIGFAIFFILRGFTIWFDCSDKLIFFYFITKIILVVFYLISYNDFVIYLFTFIICLHMNFQTSNLYWNKIMYLNFKNLYRNWSKRRKLHEKIK